MNAVMAEYVDGAPNQSATINPASEVQMRPAVRARFHVLLFLAGLSVAACGRSPGERALTGGLVGAGAGAGVSAVAGGDPVTGALVGAGVGAVGGALTAPSRGHGGPPRHSRSRHYRGY